MRHDGETHLKWQINLTGVHERMSTMRSSGRLLSLPAAVVPVTARLRFFESGASMALQKLMGSFWKNMGW